MSNIFSDLIGKGVWVYLDDIVIYWKTEEERISLLRKVLERLDEYNLRLNLEKCEFDREEIDFLGWTISKKGDSE